MFTIFLTLAAFVAGFTVGRHGFPALEAEVKADAQKVTDLAKKL